LGNKALDLADLKRFDESIRAYDRAKYRKTEGRVLI
jgi:hypothetical protein